MNNLKRYTLYVINVVDIAAILFSFFLSFFIRFRVMNDITRVVIGWNDYFPVLALFLVSYELVNILYLYKSTDYLKRDFLREFVESVKVSLMVVSATVIFLNFAKVNAQYSRIFEAIYLLVFFVTDLLLRTGIKRYLLTNHSGFGFVEKIILLARESDVEAIVSRISASEDWRYNVVGICTQKKCKEKKIAGINILGKFGDDSALSAVEYDAVLLAVNGKHERNQEIIQHFRSLGKVVYFLIEEFDYSVGYRSFENIGECPVVSYRMIAPMPRRQQIFKRVIDFSLSVALLLPYVLLAALVKLVYILESPGPILISRPRVGRNNILFRQYHFRIYRLDAWERIEKNESPYTCLGKFLEKTHLDGAPNLLNVLGGQMSFVGPKAPNLVKYLEMSVREKNILQTKPGVIGVWATLPDSDMNRIVNAEQHYIENWSVLKDVAIFANVALRYIALRSYRVNGETHIGEELEIIRSISHQKREFFYLRNYTGVKSFRYRAYLFWKRVFDFCAALVGIAVLAIPMLILMFLVYLDDGGSPFYGHERIGKEGKRIKIYKFRSMRVDAGNLEEFLTADQLEQYRREFKVVGDPRITKIGNVLRKTSLDELPQLFNILKGDLSVVGPRPVVEEEMKRYGKDVAKLLSVQPGLTGYWQAYARNRAGYEDGSRQKMEMYYVDNQHFLLDIRIIFKTFLSVIRQEGVE